MVDIKKINTGNSVKSFFKTKHAVYLQNPYLQKIEQYLMYISRSNDPLKHTNFKITVALFETLRLRSFKVSSSVTHVVM